MPTDEFLERIVSRLDRIDRKSLERYVTELADEKQLLSQLLDHVPHGIMVLTNRSEILYLNRRMVHLFNIPDTIRPKAIISEAISDVPFVQWLEKQVELEEEKFHEEIEVLLPRPMVLQVTLQFEKKSHTTMAFLFVSNLTERDMNTRERFQLQNWESMISLAAGIAHEVGNPLNSLTIHLALLTKALKKVPAGEKKKIDSSVRAMTDEIARLDKIVRNFLRATRRKPLRFELVQVNQLIDKTVTLLKPELKAGRISVRQALDKEIPPFLLDAERMQQVFLNLIINAIHAMPQKGTLQISTELQDKLCLLHFQDTGVGIPENRLPRIFDAYFTTKEEGSGLGLLIVYQIVREHGGRIEVASKPNQGTTFTIILPLRKEKLGLPGPRRRLPR